jgi:predicted transcriptional regulator with HTH domain
MLKQIIEEVRESKLDVKSFQKLLDKYDYSDDPEEISFALEDDEIAVMGSLKEIVNYLNKKGVSAQDVEEMLKDALA